MKNKKTVLAEIKSMKPYKETDHVERFLWNTRGLVIHDFEKLDNGKIRGKFKLVPYHPVVFTKLLFLISKKLFLAIFWSIVALPLEILECLYDWVTSFIREIKKSFPSLKELTLDCRNKYKKNKEQ